MSEKAITKTYLRKQLENFYTKIIYPKIYEASIPKYSFTEMSSDEYNALTEVEKNDSSKIYFIK